MYKLINNDQVSSSVAVLPTIKKYYSWDVMLCKMLKINNITSIFIVKEAEQETKVKASSKPSLLIRP
jgi:hypothetical protein